MTRRTHHRKRHLRGGAPKLPLNPSTIDSGNIKFLDPSPLLNRNVPYIPPRPGAPSPPPPLGMTSGPAFGLKINGPPLLAGGKRRKRTSKKKCNCSGKRIPLILFGGKKFKKHYMWTRKGKKYCAKTHKQHLRGVRKGHTHKKPKRR